jgi:2-isopropylmalate synthase
MAKEEIIRSAVEGVKIAREFCEDVEFSPEDASRTELEFLAQVVEAVIAAGATTVNIPDTVGYTVPHEFSEMFRYLRKNVRGIEKVRLSVHCHDDLGMAVANSLAAVEAGARQIECTITGIGERAGNAALEEIVMAIRTRPERYGVHTGIRTPRLFGTARLLATLIGASIPRNKAIVGDNAFAHESGIHQHGMIADRSTYEIMRPEDVGFPGTLLVLGKHSGRAAVRDRLAQLGYPVPDASLDELMVSYKRLADRKKEVFDADLEALWLGVDPDAPHGYTMDSLQVTTAIGTRSEPTASVSLRDQDGRAMREAAVGDGPIDAIAGAIGRATGITFEVRDYHVRSLTGGVDAQGQATVRVVNEGREYRGQAVTTDVIEASAQALLEAVNRIASTRAARARHRAGLGSAMAVGAGP